MPLSEPAVDALRAFFSQPRGRWCVRKVVVDKLVARFEDREESLQDLVTTYDGDEYSAAWWRREHAARA